MMIDIEFLHFTPRDAFKKELTQQVQKILAECPSDADAQVRAMFDPDRFVLEISVRSSQGRFRSSVGVPIPKKGTRDRAWQTTAVEEMASEVSRQIRKWRAHRFDDEEERQAA